MKLWNHYYTPQSTEEAISLLRDYGGQARVIAGGTDLLVDMRAAGEEPHEALIDITRIPELATIEQINNSIYIGAGVTHTQIVKSPLIAQYATCLVESCGVVGGPQVRNVATLGGNVAHALPAGDGTTSLVALDSEAEVIHNGEQQWKPLTELFLGPGKSLLDSSRDLLIRFRFPISKEREATAFKRIMRPQGIALPILGCAVWVQLDEGKTTFEAARISIAPIGPTPGRATEVENELTGKPATETSIQEVAAFAQDLLHPRTSKYRATADYRKEMISVLLQRTLTLAVQRAQTGQAVPEGVGV
jgi:CO/xanthine dehydrogenase FAD-binding subunit